MPAFIESILDYFLKRSSVVNLATLLILGAGAYSAFSIQKEIYPRVDYDVILVSMDYPGTAVEDIERLLTIPLERELKIVENIKEMNAISMEERTIIYLKVAPEANLREVEADIRSVLDRIDDLPADVKPARIALLNNKTRSVLKIGMHGKDLATLTSVAKKLRDELEFVAGVSKIDIEGDAPLEILIRLDPVNMAKYELTFSEVAQVISNRNLTLSAGLVREKMGEITIRTIGEYLSPEEVGKTVVRSNFAGQKILLEQLAIIEVAPNPDRLRYRSQGKTAVFVEVHIRENADVIKTTDLVKKEIKTFFESSFAQGVSYSIFDDFSFFVKRRLNILIQNGLMGWVLVFACLLLFLNWRTALVTSLGVPVAFMAAFIMMDFLGISINMISMFGLILVSGMLIDDSIIVAEHYYQKLEQGQSQYQAAKSAALDTVLPITGMILTTMIAFGALFFMGGIMGKFLWAVPAVVIICLIASWVESFFFLPAHLNAFCPYNAKSAGKRSWWNEKLRKLYGVVLVKCLEFPKVVLLTFILFFCFSIWVAKNMRFELFPGDDVTTVFVQIKGKVGTPLNDTDQAIARIEDIILTLPKEEIDQLKSTAGLYRSEHGSRTDNHYGSLVLYLTMPNMRKRSTDEILAELTEKAGHAIPGFEVTIRKIDGGPPKGKPIDIELYGDSLEDLRKMAEEVKIELNKLPGILSSEIDYEEGKKQLVVSINEGEAKRLGVSVKDIALELRRAFSRDEFSQIRRSEDDIPIKLALTTEREKNWETIKLLHVPSLQGRPVPLVNVITTQWRPGAFVIRRLNKKRVVAVQATLDKKITTPMKVTGAMTPIIDSIRKKYPEIRYVFGGESADTKESMDGLKKAGFMAINAIYLILVILLGSLLQPLIIMSTIPLGLIGVVMSFKMMGMALGFMASMGIVALVGVVVNDSIVMVTFINKQRQSEKDLVKAILEGSISRLRPVLLTTMTTVAGLLPLAHSSSGDPFLKPMAMSFAYGLMFATIVTLIFVPSLYLIYARIILKFSKD